MGLGGSAFLQPTNPDAKTRIETAIHARFMSSPLRSQYFF
jgi:hypothetical protein